VKHKLQYILKYFTGKTARMLGTQTGYLGVFIPHRSRGSCTVYTKAVVGRETLTSLKEIGNLNEFRHATFKSML
jgi:hypothetical protein